MQTFSYFILIFGTNNGTTSNLTNRKQTFKFLFTTTTRGEDFCREFIWDQCCVIYKLKAFPNEFKSPSLR